MKNVNTQKALQQKRFFTVLPLLLLPFITLFFWALDGGKGNEVVAAQETKGINASIPEVNPEEQKPLDKMSYYQHAAADSAKLQEQKRNDPYYRQGDLSGSPRLSTSYTALASSGTSPLHVQEEKVLKKLEQLQATLAEPSPPAKAKPYHATVKELNPIDKDIQQLEKMMKTMQENEGEDPELVQLNGMLEKILAIQHPEQYQAKPVVITPASLKLFSAVPAIIEENQKVSQGSVIKIRILEDALWNGHQIPKDHLIYGTCEMSNQRLKLRIRNIRLGHSLLPVDLLVFDMNDGMEGIYVPDALVKDAVNNGSDQALQGIQVLPFDQSISTQLAGAGISAAKGLFSKRIKSVKAKLKAGYPLLLKNNQITN